MLHAVTRPSLPLHPLCTPLAVFLYSLFQGCFCLFTVCPSFFWEFVTKEARIGDLMESKDVERVGGYQSLRDHPCQLGQMFERGLEEEVGLCLG